jgi:hypothetical protein
MEQVAELRDVHQNNHDRLRNRRRPPRDRTSQILDEIRANDFFERSKWLRMAAELFETISSPLKMLGSYVAKRLSLSQAEAAPLKLVDEVEPTSKENQPALKADPPAPKADPLAPKAISAIAKGNKKRTASPAQKSIVKHAGKMARVKLEPARALPSRASKKKTGYYSESHLQSLACAVASPRTLHDVAILMQPRS